MASNYRVIRVPLTLRTAAERIPVGARYVSVIRLGGPVDIRIGARDAEPLRLERAGHMWTCDDGAIPEIWIQNAAVPGGVMELVLSDTMRVSLFGDAAPPAPSIPNPLPVTVEDRVTVTAPSHEPVPVYSPSSNSPIYVTTGTSTLGVDGWRGASYDLATVEIYDETKSVPAHAATIIQHSFAHHRLILGMSGETDIYEPAAFVRWRMVQATTGIEVPISEMHIPSRAWDPANLFTWSSHGEAFTMGKRIHRAVWPRPVIVPSGWALQVEIPLIGQMQRFKCQCLYMETGRFGAKLL